jgi:hydrophobe/amphiphile efflux-1 (HAE1) family protein
MADELTPIPPEPDAPQQSVGISAVFVHRPVATLLLAVGLFLVGAAAFVFLPVAPLPRVDFPTIRVQAKLPGADPETMAATAAAPLERRLGEIPGVTEMTSTSSEGASSIVVQFDLDRDIEGAAHDVEAAINASGSDLPVDLPTPPTYRKLNPSDSPILILAVTSTTLSPGKLYDACDSILNQRISQVEGVAQVTVSGADKPAVRVQVDPDRLTTTGLGLEDVRTAIDGANVNEPKGTLNGPRQSYSVAANDQLTTAASYAPLLLRSNDATSLRLSDVARVTDSVENDRQAGWYDNGSAVIVIIQKQADANVIETVDRIKAILPQLERWMPPGSKVSVLADRTQTIRASVDDVEMTLMISIVLVVLVVLFSLGRVTPTVAAIVTVPLSLAGTFAVMWLMDYSLNNISLMALIVSVGFVVDDAIVMIENIARHAEHGESPLEAAVRGAREITFTVISISVSLVAVFIPLLFMGGIIGRMFREFAVTLTVAIAISAVVSITVTPTVYGQLLKRPKKLTDNWFTGAGERCFAWLQRHYERGLEWVLRHHFLTLCGMLLTVVLTVLLYIVVPKGFFPQQDTGMIIGNTDARTDISFQAMKVRQMEVNRIILSDPAVEGLGSAIGSNGPASGSSHGRIYIALKPLSERDVSADQVVNRLRAKLAHVEGMNTFLQASQDIRVGGRSSKAEYQLSLRDESLEEMREWTPKFISRLKQEPGVTDVSSDQDAASLQENVIIDRDAASRLNVSVEAIDQVLQDAFAQRQISNIYTHRNQYHVVMEVTGKYQQGPDALKHIFVKAEDGTPVRLSAVARFEMGLAPVSITHEGQFPAATLTFNLPPGKTLSDANDSIRKVANELRMPPSVHMEFAGNAKAFAESTQDEPILIGAALLAIYIVLGILYENTFHPLTILSTLPSAGIGALLAIIIANRIDPAAGYNLSIISLIGVILLMGIVKKNGIMLVDFAIIAERAHGKTPLQAMVEACDKRFRPILMTTLAAVLGAVPLIVAGGNGAELRRPLGISIVGGLIVSQFLTLYTTPVVYLYLSRLSDRLRRCRERHGFASNEPLMGQV